MPNESLSDNKINPVTVITDSGSNDTGGSAQEARKRKANLKSRNNIRFWYTTLIFVVVSAILAIASYFYLNREHPVVELKVAAGPYRSDSFELMREVADVVSRQSKFLRLKVMPTKDSSRNISALNQGFADLATIRSDTPVVADIRLVADLFPDLFQLIAGPNTSINRVFDLVGKTVAIPPFGSDEFRSFWAVADHYDISITSVKWKTMPIEQASEMLLNGKIDALFTVRSLRDRQILNLFEDAGLKGKILRLVEIDQAAAISIKRPFLRSAVIPKGTYSGQPVIPFNDAQSSAVIRTLVSRSDVASDAINELTRILFENRFDLIIRFALASAIQKPNIEAGLTVPFHEGAEQYYDRDQPSFLQENAEPIALLITIAVMIGSGLLALRSRLVGKQKNRMDSYNYVLLDIADAARKEVSLTEIHKLNSQHYGILETVVRALDTDEVTEEGFQSFSLLWESVREVLNERKRELITKA